MPDEYEVGQTVRLETTFRDSAGALADPTTIVCTVENPSGTETAPTVGDDAGVGAYHADVTANLPGTWQWRWKGSGGGLGTGVDAVDEGFFVVRRSAF